jgi:hypothetical protein
LIECALVRPPAARAGFFFALQTLFRSAPHRVVGAITLAVGIAVTAVCVRAAASGEDAQSAPLTLLALQTLVLVVVTVGFRHATRLPADLRASPVYWLSMTGDERRFVEGVKRALMFGIGVPAIAALVPLHAIVLGAPVALAHAATGFLVLCILIDAAFAGSSRVPFVSVHVSAGNVVGLAPIYGTIVLVVAFGLAWVERAALTGVGGWLFLCAGLALILVIVRWSGRARDRDLMLIRDLDELPDLATQRLSLNE